MTYCIQKEPLFRKVNTRARMSHHNSGGDYRHDRNTKEEQNSEATHSSMHAKVKRGLDYTPLYRFLLSKVGQDWTKVCSEAVSRLDKEDPIYWIVAKTEEDKSDIVLLGETSYYNGLYVDDANTLQKVSLNAGPANVNPWCTCCTYTFNGKPIEFQPPSKKNKM